MMRKVIVLTIIALMATSGVMASVASASSSTPYNTQVQVPYYVYGGESFHMYVNNTYGFTNYTVTVYFAGSNLTGFSPTNTYHNFSASNPDFVIPIKAPTQNQQLTFLVKTTADSPTGQAKTSSTYVVNVIQPVHLYASVKNTDSAAIYNVTVNFYVDNNYVASKTITRLGSGQTEMVNYTWVAPLLSKGEHTLTAQVNNTLLSINGGGNSATSHFYYGNPPNYNWIYYIVAVVAVFMLVMAMGAGRRPRVGERKPKWKK